MNWIIAGATLAALGLALYHLGSRSYWSDEGVGAQVTTWSWSHAFSYSTGSEPNFAAYYLALKLWSIVFGHGEAMLRLPSALAFVATVPVGAAIARRVAGRQAAAIAAVLIALHDNLLRWGQQVRPYTLAVLFTALSVLLLLRARERSSRGRWSLWAVVAALACFAHPFSALAVAGSVAALLVTRENRRVLLITSGVVVAVTLPLVVLLARIGTARIAWIPERSLFGSARVIGMTAALSGVVGLVYGSAAVYGVVTAPRSPMRRMIVAWGVAPAAIAFVVSSFTPILEERYLLVSTPAVAIAAAAGLSRLRTRALVAGATVAIVALSSISLHGWYAGSGEDWRAAGALVRANDAPGDVVFVPFGQPAFQDYFEGKPGADASVLHAVPSDARGVWRLIRLATEGARKVQNTPLAGHHLTAQYNVNGIVIQRFDRSVP